MDNFKIVFSSPLFLLFLIPLIALTFIPHFRLTKRFRRTRNRIISLVMHLTVVSLSVLVLAGMTVSYTVANEKNEIILLVDVSDTERISAEKRDEFVRTVLNQSKFDSYRVGVVTFGYDQNYAVPLTDDVSGIYEKYEAAALPDTSATNIAGALLYAKGLFENPETSKIVLITDGKETDNEAASVIRSIAAGGTKIDVADIPSHFKTNEVEITGLEFPDYHVSVGEEFDIAVTVKANIDGFATFELSDNDVKKEISPSTTEFHIGEQTINVRYKFETSGLHEIKIAIASSENTLENNDGYRSYFYLRVFNKVLMIGRKSAECEPLKKLLTNEKEFDVTVKNILEDEDFLNMTADYLRGYDEIILNNVAFSDMPEDFDKILYKYVYEYGGGLLTVGGQDETDNAHSYVRSDMINTDYQKILPVQAIDYTPPLGVVVIIDRSGSMGNIDNATNMSYLELATHGAKSCLNAMSERDYMGVVTLDTNESVVLPMTPRTQESKILSAIESIREANGGTVLPGAIQKAGELLRGIDVAKRHIILVTDGVVSEKEEYEAKIKENYDVESARVTFSVVLIGSDEGSDAALNMKAAAETGHGRFYTITDRSIEYSMREDLKAPSIITMKREKFNPVVYNPASPIFNGVNYGNDESGGVTMNVALQGFYGVKLKKDADLLLCGDYNVPVYAQWKFGKGTAGSFMCDLSGNWSGEFMSDADGIRFIKNAVSALMPTEDIRPSEINVTFSENNYTNRLDVYTSLNGGEYVTGNVIKLPENETLRRPLDTVTSEEDKKTNPDCYVLTAFGADNNYSRCEFVIKAAGVYRIVIEKRSEDGSVLCSREFFKAFSYSEEYDVLSDPSDEELAAKFSVWAERGNGAVIKDLEDPEEIFGTFVTNLLRTYDPRTLFLILAIILFLTDVAVRKFKFKWPHELIKEYKAKKNEK